MSCTKNGEEIRKSSVKLKWLAGENFEESDCVKDLEILIQNTVLFDRYTEENVRGVYALLAKKIISFRFINGDVFKRIFPTYVRPKFDYCVFMCSPISKKYTDKLERMQKICN